MRRAVALDGDFMVEQSNVDGHYAVFGEVFVGNVFYKPGSNSSRNVFMKG